MMSQGQDVPGAPVECRTIPAKPGAPRGNANARTHGLYAARRKLADGELEVLVAEKRRELYGDHEHGERALSPRAWAVLDEAARQGVLKDTVDGYLAEVRQGAIIDRRRRRVKPIVMERIRIGESFVKLLKILGLDRAEKRVPSLGDWLSGEGEASDPTDQPGALPSAPETQGEGD